MLMMACTADSCSAVRAEASAGAEEGAVAGVDAAAIIMIYFQTR